MRQDASDASLRSALARGYAAQHQKEKSQVEISAVLSLSPENAENLENLADAYLDLGDTHQAMKVLQKSIKLGLTRDILQDDPTVQPLVQEPQVLAMLK